MMTVGDIGVVLKGQTGTFVAQMNAANLQLERLQGNLIRVTSVAQPLQAHAVAVGASLATQAVATKAATSSMVAYGAAMKTTGEQTIGFGRTLGTFIALPLVFFMRAAIKSFADFEQGMRNVNSIAKQSEAALANTSAQVLLLSRELGKSPKELANALYDINSSGLVGAEALEVLRHSAMASRAGLATVQEAARATMAVINAYGLSAYAAADINDILFKTVERGVITFGELSKGLGVVVSTASAARVPFAQVGAAMAVLTKGGIESAESFTSLNRLLVRLITGTAELNDLFAETEYKTAAAMLTQKGFAETMGVILKRTGGSAILMKQLGFEVRDLKAALALTRNSGKDFAEELSNIDNINKRASSSMQAFMEQAQSLQFQMDRTKVAFTNFSVVSGESMSADLRALAKGLENLFDWFNSLPSVVKRIGSAIAVLTVGVAGLTISMGALVKISGVALATLGGTTALTAMTALLASVGEVGVAFMALQGIAFATGLMLLGFGFSEKFMAQVGQLTLMFSDEAAERNKGLRRMEVMEMAVAEREKTRLRLTLLAINKETDAKKKAELEQSRILLRQRMNWKDYGEVHRAVKKEIAEAEEKAIEAQKKIAAEQEQQTIIAVQSLYEQAKQAKKNFQDWTIDQLPMLEKMAKIDALRQQARNDSMLMANQGFMQKAAELKLEEQLYYWELQRMRLTEQMNLDKGWEAHQEDLRKYAFDQLSRQEKLADIERQRAEIQAKMANAMEHETLEYARQLLALQKIEDSLQQQKKTRRDMVLESIQMGSAEQLKMETAFLNRAIKLNSTASMDSATPGADQQTLQTDRLNEIAEASKQSATAEQVATVHLSNIRRGIEKMRPVDIMSIA